MLTRPTYLMADPAHFHVGYQINPWMQPGAWRADPAANAAAARVAWSALRIALEDSGATVRTMAGAQGLPDLVFPANAAVVLDGKALVASFRHPERAGEAPVFFEALCGLRDAGLLTSVTRIEGLSQEGAGDCIWDAARGLFWVGSGPRSHPDTAAMIADHFGRPVVHLPLATERFYHLDTCFCPLSGGEILYYPPALSADALRRLHDRVPAAQLIAATDADAAGFCVNAVCLDRTIVMATPPAGLRRRLEALGYAVLAVDLAPFILSGGGAFCMTLRLDLVSAPADRPARAPAPVSV